MSLQVRVEPLERDVIVDLAGLSGEEASAAIAAYAREQLGEAQAINAQALGSVPPHETFVDGREGVPLESVRPEGGRIVFKFDLVLDLFAWIGAQLVEHSPHLRGVYAASHIFLADGVEMEAGAAVPEADEYVFINVQPYARKIERGQSSQAPDGVYEAVALLAQKRFGNVAKISFTFRSVVGASPLSTWASTTRLGGRRSGVRRRDWLTRQPAIVIRPGGGR
jgi:hypothetical protein